MGFWFPRKIFVFLGACLSKIETELFSKAAWVLTVDILVQISNLNWSLLNCLILQYINFLLVQTFRFCFENSIYHMMIITQASFKGISLHKSMHEHSAPSKHCFLFHHLVKDVLLKEIFCYFIFCVFVKITKNELSKIVTDMSNAKKSCLPGM